MHEQSSRFNLESGAGTEGSLLIWRQELQFNYYIRYGVRIWRACRSGGASDWKLARYTEHSPPDQIGAPDRFWTPNRTLPKALILTNRETRCCIIMSELSRRRWAYRCESTFKELQKIDVIWVNAKTTNVPIDKNDRDTWLINSEIIIVPRRSAVWIDKNI